MKGLNRQFLKMLDPSHNHFNTPGDYYDAGGGDYSHLRMHCGKDSNIYIGSCCEIYDCVLYADKGASININSNCRLNGLVIRAEGKGSTVSIGTRSCAEGYSGKYNVITCLRGTTVEIGSECLLSGGVEIHTAEDCMTMRFDDEAPNTQPEDVKIGDNVWIKNNAYIEQGVSIGHDSVVEPNTHISNGSGYPPHSRLKHKVAVHSMRIPEIRWKRE